MDNLWVLILVAVLAAAIYVQVAARKQVTVETSLSPDQAAQVVKKYFGLTWNEEGGPGDFNYSPKLRRDPPTISINTKPAPNGGSHVDIWVSGATHMLGFMGHAMLMWRKKRGLAAKLAT